MGAWPENRHKQSINECYIAAAVHECDNLNRPKAVVIVVLTMESVTLNFATGEARM